MVTYLSIYRYRDPPRGKSGFKGVIYCRGLSRNPWKAYIRKNGEYINLGYYPTKEAAALAYNEAARRLHRPDTYLNPVQPKQDPKALLKRGLELLRSARA